MHHTHYIMDLILYLSLAIILGSVNAIGDSAFRSFWIEQPKSCDLHKGNRVVNGNAIASRHGESKISCAKTCSSSVNCKSINYNMLTRECQLNEQKASSDCGNVQHLDGWSYFEMVSVVVVVVDVVIILFNRYNYHY